MQKVKVKVAEDECLYLRGGPSLPFNAGEELCLNVSDRNAPQMNEVLIVFSDYYSIRCLVLLQSMYHFFVFIQHGAARVNFYMHVLEVNAFIHSVVNIVQEE